MKKRKSGAARSKVHFKEADMTIERALRYYNALKAKESSFYAGLGSKVSFTAREKQELLAHKQYIEKEQKRLLRIAREARKKGNLKEAELLERRAAIDKRK